jgi:hypothetical protein
MLFGAMSGGGAKPCTGLVRLRWCQAIDGLESRMVMRMQVGGYAGLGLRAKYGRHRGCLGGGDF